MARNQTLDKPQTQDRTEHYWSKKKGEGEINIMIPNDILLFFLIGALSSCHQKDFTAQQMGADAESHSRTLYGERV